MQTTHLDSLNTNILRLESGISALSNAISIIEPKLHIKPIVNFGQKAITNSFNKALGKKLDDILAFDKLLDKLENSSISMLDSITKSSASMLKSVGENFSTLFKNVQTFAKLNPFAFMGYVAVVITAIALIAYNWDYLCEAFHKTKHILVPLLGIIGTYIGILKVSTLSTFAWISATSKLSLAFSYLSKTILANPLAFFVSVAVGVLTWLVMNIDSVSAVWGNLMAHFRGLGGIFEWLANIADLFIGNLLKGISWAIEKFKGLSNLFGVPDQEVTYTSLDKLPDFEQTIAPSNGIQTLNSTNSSNELPAEHLDFLSKNTLSVSSNIKKSVDLSHKNTSNSNTQIINIDKVEISDGIISDLEDFVFQLQRKITI